MKAQPMSPEAAYRLLADEALREALRNLRAAAERLAEAGRLARIAEDPQAADMADEQSRLLGARAYELDGDWVLADHDWNSHFSFDIEIEDGVIRPTERRSNGEPQPPLAATLTRREADYFFEHLAQVTRAGIYKVSETWRDGS